MLSITICGGYYMQETNDKVVDLGVRRDRFVRIVERRVNKILSDLDYLGKCSNKRNYEYSAQDTVKVFRAIEKKVRETKLLFQEHNHSKKNFFLKT